MPALRSSLRPLIDGLRRRAALSSVFLVLAALAAWNGACQTVAQPAPPLHTAGAKIVDSNGNLVRLNATNWYGSESSDYVVAGLQAEPLQTIVNQIKSLGFNAVRLPWSNQMVESNPVVQNYALAANPSLEGENALTIYDQVVGALTNAGIMVILDNHSSNAEWCCSTADGNELWYNSQYPQANWIADWQSMARRYAGNPMVIGADLRNEPRGTATWGGSTATDWHAAAQLGGDAVLGVNPNLLIFVEGVSYAGDLSGVANLPVQLSTPNRVVYEAHDYGYWYSGLAGYSSYVNDITPKWGYLATGSNPQPLWIGEFGTCNSADTCVSSASSGDNGYWFELATSYMQQYGLNWSYWAINGTQSTGSGRTWGTAETYGILNTSWNGSALASLTARLQSLMGVGSPGVALIPSGSAITVAPGAATASVITIVPQNGFTGTVNLSCSVSGGAANPPACSVPASVSLSGNATADAAVTVTAAGSPGSGSAPVPTRFPGRTTSGAVFACAVLCVAGVARRRGVLLFVLIGLMIAFPLLACGASGGGSSTAATSAGTYTVTVTGTASGMGAASVQIPVHVP